MWRTLALQIISQFKSNTKMTNLVSPILLYQEGYSVRADQVFLCIWACCDFSVCMLNFILCSVISKFRCCGYGLTILGIADLLYSTFLLSLTTYYV